MMFHKNTEKIKSLIGIKPAITEKEVWHDAQDAKRT
jgi:hypothetical protein